MKALLYSSALVLACTTLFSACHDEATTLGGEVMPNNDQVSIEQALYKVTTQSVMTGAMQANAKNSYLGSIIDPDTKATTTCSYMAQFHVPEPFSLPAKSTLVTDAQGDVVVDSCVIRINHDTYFGDSLAIMKVKVQEIDRAKGLSETATYNTDLDPTQFVTPGVGESTTVAYTALDQNRSATSLSNTNIYRNIAIPLTADFGHRILNAYYTQPQYFKNSYEFAKNLCAGFSFQHDGGMGAVIEVALTTLDIYYRKHTQTTAGNDTIVTGLMRLGATQEVVQNTLVDNQFPSNFQIDNQPYTYIKAPAGIHTVATLPVNDIVAGTHYKDSLNSAKFALRTVNADQVSGTTLDKPSQLLLLPLDKLSTFFQGSALPDNVFSYLSSYSTGAYTFSNIAPLVSYLRAQRDRAAGVTATDSEATRLAKWAVWEQAHPNWNKVAIIPVSGDYTTATDVYGNKTTTLQRLRNDFKLSSVRLEGGTSPIELSVIYSRFAQ
ncbi:MAG: DUF4270 domain-containing protein [Bacteroidaceae bacterium]|nr:DUF4270 domain-containing protein [Bacteroidaceae bacterium]